MSEYQYYEFQAIDRPLTEREMRELRSRSTRATITPTRFVNHYNFGDLKADPMKWVEKYFDAFLYLANWGNRTLALRLPSGVVPADEVAAYCPGGAATVTGTDAVTILEFRSDCEAEDWDELDDDALWLTSLLPLRADIAAGDYRALYLGWLLCVQQGDLNADVLEPPVSPGLKQPTEALKALVHFLRIDPDLLGVAALISRDENVRPTWRALTECIGSLPEAEKTDLLVRLAMGEEPHLRAELLQRCRSGALPSEAEGPSLRTVRELLAAAEEWRAERHRLEADRLDRERERQERERAVVRQRYLDELLMREGDTWEQVEALITTRQSRRYDEAVALIRDLMEVAERDGRGQEAAERVDALRQQHARKNLFIARLRREGIIAER